MGTVNVAAYLDLVVNFPISSIDRFVVRVFDRSRKDRVGQNDDHHHAGKARRLNHLREDRRRQAFLLVLVDVHQLQGAVLCLLQHLRCCHVGLSRTSAPHLLELHTNFREGLDDNGDEHILDCTSCPLPRSHRRAVLTLTSQARKKIIVMK